MSVHSAEMGNASNPIKTLTLDELNNLMHLQCKLNEAKIELIDNIQNRIDNLNLRLNLTAGALTLVAFSTILQIIKDWI